MHSTLLTGFSVAGLFGGLQSIKFLDASQFRFCLLYGNGVGRPEYRALQRVPSVFFCAKRTALHGFCPVEQSFLSIKSSYLPVSRKPTRRATVSVENQRGSCGFPLRLSREKAAQPSPQAWLSCKTKIVKSAVTPALPAAPARSRCSGTCRWNSVRKSGRIPLQCWRCSGGFCTAQCSPDAWGAWAAPYGQPCRSQ